MRIVNLKHRKLIPLVIAGSLVVSGNLKYDAIDHSKTVYKTSNQEVANYMQNANDRYYSNLSVKSIFDEKLKLWKQNTMFLSFADQIVADENFKEIVSMGERAVPFILNEITNQPSTLVWALNFIFNKRITENPKTTIAQACQLWIEEMR